MLLGEILAHCQAVYGERLVTCAVYGSVGRGTPRPDSDVDLLVIVDDLPAGRVKRVQEFEKAEERVAPYLEKLKFEGLSTCLSPVIKTPAEVKEGSLLFLDMLEDARILYDKGDFFASYLLQLKDRLERLGAVKFRRGNSWYWVLKPDYRFGEVFRI
ncbi:DNA polymerase III subunit beta [Clostridiales bacterium PH28_bin88]|nr:DNA polymerase III subunit beta [Clostridiales bacterium PH28_bin88]